MMAGVFSFKSFYKIDKICSLWWPCEILKVIWLQEDVFDYLIPFVYIYFSLYKWFQYQCWLSLVFIGLLVVTWDLDLTLFDFDYLDFDWLIKYYHSISFDFIFPHAKFGVKIFRFAFLSQPSCLASDFGL